MKVAELIARLQTMDAEIDIAILDGENGGGFLRRINFGPHRHVRAILQQDQIDNCADFEHLPLGTPIYYMGFGCY